MNNRNGRSKSNRRHKHKMVKFFFLLSLAWSFNISNVSASNDASVALHRETVSFDFGWKYRAGLHRWPNDPYEPPINTTGIGYVDPGPFPEEASNNTNTTEWLNVRLPHDGLISNPYGNAPSLKACPDGCSGRSYIPRHVLWYRKQFQLPTRTSTLFGKSLSWQNDLLDGTSRIYLRFDGSFRNTTVYINGVRVFQHECGYTPFHVELTADNLGLELGNGDRNVHTIAVFVDPNNGDGGGPSRASGWWYEGGGLYRHVWLEKVPRIARIAQEGVFCKSRILFHPENNNAENNLSAVVQTNRVRSLQTFKNESLDSKNRANHASVVVQATIEIEDLDEDYMYGFEVEDESKIKKSIRLQSLKNLVQNQGGEQGSIGFRGSHTRNKTPKIVDIVSEPLWIPNPRLWTSSNPELYKITISLYKQCKDGTDAILIDKASVHHGIRSTRFDPDKGFFLNEKPFKIRGFCDHDTFAVVGMAVPDRMNLFRAQASRSIGGNARRASHNPPNPEVLAIYDRLGMLVIDENRLFDNNTVYVKNMANLVKRDRNHPSVIVWSFCNEVDCEGEHEAGGPAFQAVTDKLDGSRPTLANMFTFHDLLSDTIDVQGFSHRDRETLEQCHAELPNKPIIQSECCSCNTMRDTDEGCETMSDNPHTTCDQKSFNARCLEKLVNASDGIEYSSGTFIWTLLDYYGEPPSRPLTVSSTYGQFDLCGFPKSSAFWFRSQWLLGPTSKQVDAKNSVAAAAIANGKPFDTNDLVEIHIVESWESSDNWNQTVGNKTRTIHVYSNAPVVELFVTKGDNSKNFVSLGKRRIVPMVEGNEGTYGEWEHITWEPGVLLAKAYNAGGIQVATTQKPTNPLNPKVSLVLSLDCPSPDSGTGSALFLDGSDVALIRATLVDLETNQRLIFSDNIVEFKIVSGPGRILGTANGDPKSKLSHTDSFHPAHHGLVRAVVGVTSIAGWSSEEIDLLSSMEVDDESVCETEGGTANLHYCYSKIDDRDIVIEATSEGLLPVRLTIPTSTNGTNDSVLSVATREAGRPVNLLMG